MTVTVTIDPHRRIGTIDEAIYGHFLESNFYGNIEGGLRDEGSSLSYDGPGPLNGLRTYVIAACRELDIPVVRWPGGNFTSGYHWEDGVGPAQDRPRRFELAWHGVEDNRFGTDEFLAWCAEIAAEPYLRTAPATSRKPLAGWNTRTTAATPITPGGGRRTGIRSRTACTTGESGMRPTGHGRSDTAARSSTPPMPASTRSSCVPSTRNCG